MRKITYSRHFNKILAYAQAQHITIILDDSVGVSCISDRTIYFDKNEAMYKQIYTLLHELGHFEDDIRSDYKFDETYSIASKKLNENKSISQKEFRTIMSCEISAWDHAEIIAKKLKIKLGKKFYQFRQKCLLSYMKDTRVKGLST